MSKMNILTGAIALLVASFMAQAQRAATSAEISSITLREGDSAPAIAPGEWLKGEPVAKFERGKFYVIDFWGMWCESCTVGLPHMSRLQKQYKDIIFIAQDWAERDPARVRDFVREMGDKLNCRVALDDVRVSGNGRIGRMGKDWMIAAGNEDTTFVVDRDGKIAWIGQPFDVDNALRDMASGPFNPARHAAEREIKQELDGRFYAAMRAQKFEGAIAFLDQRAKLQPAMADFIATLKFNVLRWKKDYPSAWNLGQSFSETFKNGGHMFNDLAATIWSWNVSEKQGLDLAESLATRAVEITRGEDGYVLLTLARVEFLRGNIDKAIEIQTRAMTKESRTGTKAMQANLDYFKTAKEKAMKTQLQ